jgi:hypothetical protein
MIVEPDFLTHWKTRELVRITEDPAAPLMLIRLWAHCHYRKTSRFPNLSDSALAGICHWQRNPPELRAILLELGLIEQKGDYLVVHDWDDTNRFLVSAWINGAKGGRPRKRILPMKKPGGKPTGKPNHESGEPVGEPKEEFGEPVGEPVLSNLYYLSYLKEGVRGRFEEWVEVRKAMGKKPKAWDAMFLEQAKWLSEFSEPDQIEILSASIRNNWQGLRAPARSTNNHRSMSAFEIEKRKAAIGEEINKIFKSNGGKRVPGDGIDELKKRRDELHHQLVA